MFKHHRRLAGLFVLGEMVTELGITITIRLLLTVFFPKNVLGYVRLAILQFLEISIQLGLKIDESILQIRRIACMHTCLQYRIIKLQQLIDAHA